MPKLPIPMHKKHLITGTPTINNSKECADNYRINTRKNWHNRFDNSGVVRSEYLDFPRINILAMAKSLTEPEFNQYNTNELLDTKS
jgi:uncharacterized protein with ParB-like and HNH nuclease domain